MRSLSSFARNWFVLFFLLSLLAAAPSQAVIVHHCDYGEHSGEVHSEHQPNEGNAYIECGNTDEHGNTFPGECEHNSAFYWSFMQCENNYTTGRMTCQLQGTIDCPGGDKSYSFTCSGPLNENGARADAARDFAYCAGEAGTIADECGCDTPGVYCSNQ